MKIAFGMIVFNGNQVLNETLESIYPYANQILIAEGPVQFWQDEGYTTSTDGTNEVLDNFPDPENKIKIVHSQYSEKDEQCNTYMQFLREDNDYIWNLDCDEVFKPQDIETIIGLLERERYTSVGFKSLSFYGGFDRYLTGFEERAEFLRIRKIYPGSYWSTHRPPTVAHRINDPWPERHLDFNYLADNYGIRMYHYSYVFPDQVYNKLKYYRESLNQHNCLDDYFNQIYTPWVTGDAADKQKIEDKYQGVHEWKPASRGDCYTTSFEGTHPQIIFNNIEQLKDKFNSQLQYFLNGGMPMFKDFNDCLAYHNISDNNLAFRAVLDNPEIIGMDKTFLDDKSPAHRRDLIWGEYLLKLSEHLGVVASRLLKRGQWGYETPDWFDHRHHMMNPEEESKNSWLESTSLVLRVLPENGKILNYCAGDAYFDYQFFRHMANEITCIDMNDSDEYKNYLIKKHSNTSKIEYLYEDILKHQPKEDYYDVIIMRSAIEHFSLENQILLFQKIKRAMKKTGWFCGDTPANPNRDNGKQHSAHEYEWKDENEARDVLNKYFDEVHVYSIYCNRDPRETIFWRCR